VNIASCLCASFSAMEGLHHLMFSETDANNIDRPALPGASSNPLGQSRTD
jgi:hypothetical protein